VIEMEKKLLNRIVVDQKIMVGKPIIKGTRVPVDMIVRQIAQGLKIKEILGDYPQLKEDDIKAALLYCAEIVEGESVFPLIK